MYRNSGYQIGPIKVAAKGNNFFYQVFTNVKAGCSSHKQHYTGGLRTATKEPDNTACSTVGALNTICNSSKSTAHNAERERVGR